jgi:hypothetical protein
MARRGSEAGTGRGIGDNGQIMSEKKSGRRRRLKQTPLPSADAGRPLRELFGLTDRYLPDRLAPPVDREKLIRYVRGELSASELKEVHWLLAAFRSWHDACATLLRNGAASRADSGRD